jgi:hypothetical protein
VIRSPLCVLAQCRRQRFALSTKVIFAVIR